LYFDTRNSSLGFGQQLKKFHLNFTACIFAAQIYSRHGFQGAMRIDVDKYPSTVGFEPVTLAQAATTIATFTKMTDNARISLY